MTNKNEIVQNDVIGCSTVKTSSMRHWQKVGTPLKKLSLITVL